MNKNRQKIVDKALTRLKELTAGTGEYKPDTGTGETGIDGEMDIYIRGEKLHFFVVIKAEFKPWYLHDAVENAGKNNPLLIITDRIYPAQRQALKDAGIAYIDTAGNMFIDQGTVFFWLDGNKPPEPLRPATNRAFTKVGLKVVFHFLLNEELLNVPYRVLAGTTGTAVGNIKYIIEGLEEAGFILPVNKKKNVLKNKKLLLERWITGYHETLKPALHLGDYMFWNNEHFTGWQTLNLENNPFAWGGEAAAETLTNYLNPGTLTIYTTERVAPVTRWKLVPVTGGKVKMYQKFWTDIQWDERHMAPPILVYADLIRTTDPRCIEAAKMIYEKYIKNEFE